MEKHYAGNKNVGDVLEILKSLEPKVEMPQPNGGQHNQKNIASRKTGGLKK